MTWSMTVIIACNILAFGKFIDIYHNHSRLTHPLTNTARDILVRLFLFLDEAGPRQIAKGILSIRLRYILFVYLITFVFILNLFNSNDWLAILFALIPPYLEYGFFTLLFHALLLTSLSLPIHMVFIATFRALSRRINDAAIAIALVPAIFIVCAIPFTIIYNRKQGAGTRHHRSNFFVRIFNNSFHCLFASAHSSHRLFCGTNS
jgi:hypothetical protein